MKNEVEQAGMAELLYQALETELGGVQVYEAAVRCAVNEELKEEWEEYLEQTRNHVEVVRGVFASLGLDEKTESPGRAIVRAKGKALVEAMEEALASGEPENAELVAAECVVDAETKDHQNWELIGELAKRVEGEAGRALKAAYEEVEDEEDEHLYHTMGWCRELWLQALGLPAVLPPPEERKDVKTAIGAARAKQARRPQGGQTRTTVAARRTRARQGSRRS
jgi:rubrerythrin